MFCKLGSKKMIIPTDFVIVFNSTTKKGFPYAENDIFFKMKVLPTDGVGAQQQSSFAMHNSENYLNSINYL